MTPVIPVLKEFLALRGLQEPRVLKDHKVSRVTLETLALRGLKALKVTPETLDLKVLPDLKVSRVTPVIPVPKVSRGLPDLRVTQETPDHKDFKVHKVSKVTQETPDLRAYRELQVLRALRVTPEPRVHRDLKDLPGLPALRESLGLQVLKVTRGALVQKARPGHRCGLTAVHHLLLPVKWPVISTEGLSNDNSYSTSRWYRFRVGRVQSCTRGA